MRVPAHIRFTLAELSAYGLQSAEVLAKAGSAIHLVLTERQRPLPNPGIEAACSIISVEDADGITVAVLKHPEGKTFARVTSEQTARSSPEVPIIVKSDAEGAAHVRRLFLEADIGPGDPVVPRREPPHAASAGEDRFQRGVDAMACHIQQQFDLGGPIRKIEFQYGLYSRGADMAQIDGQISLRTLGKAFLDAYRPQITISDQVRFGQAKRAMRLLLRKWRDEGNIEHLAGSPAAPAEEWADNIGDIISIEGTIDIDALAKACWSVMKEGEGR